MTTDNERFVSRRTTIRAAGLATATLTLGGAGLLFSTRRASAALDSNTLSGGAVNITGDGGDVTGFELASDTTIDLSWQGFDTDVDSVTFTLEAQRTQVGTGVDESAARTALTDDTGTTPVTLFTDSPDVITPGRNGNDTYTSTELTTTFPFAVIANELPGPNVVGTLTDGNIDAASLSSDTDDEVKLNVITFTLTAVLSDSVSGQSVTTTETGTMDFVVENLAAATDTGASISGSGSAQ